MGITGRANRHRNSYGDNAHHARMEKEYLEDTQRERDSVDALASPDTTQTERENARDYLLIRIFQLLKVVAED